MTVRTQAEILARFRNAAAVDMFGWRREVLADAMDLPTLRQAIPDVASGVAAEPVDVEQEARRYLEFAVGKVLDHRGLPASRSVDKLAEFAWLLGRDDVVAAMDAAGYPQYGAPKVKAFADGMGWDWPGDLAAALERMVQGLPCSADGCESGCGQ